MRTRSALVIASLGLLPAWPAWAFDHKCPEPGTEIWTSEISASNRPIRYDGQSGLWCLRSRGGKPINSELGHFRFYARNAQTSDLYEKYQTAAAELWPLSPGKRATFQYVGTSDGSSEGAGNGSHFYTIDITVEAQQPITVPAGRISAIPIVVSRRGQQSDYHQSSSTYY